MEKGLLFQPSMRLWEKVKPKCEEGTTVYIHLEYDLVCSLFDYILYVLS